MRVIFSHFRRFSYFFSSISFFSSQFVPHFFPFFALHFLNSCFEKVFSLVFSLLPSGRVWCKTIFLNLFVEIESVGLSVCVSVWSLCLDLSVCWSVRMCLCMFVLSFCVAMYLCFSDRCGFGCVYVSLCVGVSVCLSVCVFLCMYIDSFVGCWVYVSGCLWACLSMGYSVGWSNPLWVRPFKVPSLLFSQLTTTKTFQRGLSTTRRRDEAAQRSLCLLFMLHLTFSFLFNTRWSCPEPLRWKLTFTLFMLIVLIFYVVVVVVNVVLFVSSAAFYS